MFLCTWRYSRSLLLMVLPRPVRSVCDLKYSVVGLFSCHCRESLLQALVTIGSVTRKLIGSLVVARVAAESPTPASSQC
uniref:Putative secreted protein n=1 Tax=Ixodes ricinus TaxID=34613 RepID=A0A6B0UCU3_IXORI